MTVTTARPLIGIVDDSESIRLSISHLARAAGYATALFESAEAFLDSGRMHEMNCLVSDVQMPGLNGLELQRLLRDKQYSIPIIFVTAAHDEWRAKALEQGAVAVLGKPLNPQDLLAAIQAALESSG